MFDLWIGDTEITVFLIGAAVFIVLPLQLFLCFRAKNLLVKFLPAILFALAAVAFGIMIFMVKDWAAIGYAMLAVLSCVMLLFSGAAWGIWAVIHFIKKKKDSPPSGKM